MKMTRMDDLQKAHKEVSEMMSIRMPVIRSELEMAPLFFYRCEKIRPNFWWRFWQWALLGWKWRNICKPMKKENGYTATELIISILGISFGLTIAFVLFHFTKKFW
jgi:hypothetical protein